ncbi:TerD family protein [Segatella copri]|jgi:tellurium resistance protein TerD|uniref:TerD family protein n=2 Tax=Segatella copri TaxID=165179 RepID=A0A415KND0_9BACT|nr:TerD family protein [Segatella copri]EFB34746.1 bacterial stress protein [Segatella copri DSM 18205]MCW4073144.1 TerD family protein [Segatella copri]MCW4096730.1 TerD family protein [Segatella copri]MQN79776.1 TerD family protein [Segatella copri]MQP20636.1 TerD family protein [Segatella copri DSM 18205]
MGRFNLSKGERFKIAKSEGLSKIKVVLDWNSDADLDASTFLCGDEGVILDDAGFVFYNSENREQPFDRAVFGNKRKWMAETRPMSSDGAVLGSLDDRNGGSGEQIDVDLDKVDPNVCEIVFVVSIHDEGMTFGDVKDAFISVVNAVNDEELCRYELNEAFTEETALSVAKLVVNEDGDWEFEAVGVGHVGGLETLIDIYAS